MFERKAGGVEGWIGATGSKAMTGEECLERRRDLRLRQIDPERDLALLQAPDNGSERGAVAALERQQQEVAGELAALIESFLAGNGPRLRSRRRSWPVTASTSVQPAR